MSLCFGTTSNLSYKLRNVINILVDDNDIKKTSRFVDNSQEVCTHEVKYGIRNQVDIYIADSRYPHNGVWVVYKNTQPVSRHFELLCIYLSDLFSNTDLYIYTDFKISDEANSVPIGFIVTSIFFFTSVTKFSGNSKSVSKVLLQPSNEITTRQMMRLIVEKEKTNGLPKCCLANIL